MNSLYLIRSNDGEITVAEFSAIAGDLSGAKNLRTKNVFRASAEVDYSYQNDRTIIRLSEDRKLIEVTGVGKASIQAVFEIQKRYAYPLRLFNMDYTFDFTLIGVTSVEELMGKMNRPA